MSHQNKESLTHQIEKMLVSKLRAGESKFEVKRDGSYRNYIYSYSTLRTYLRAANDFCHYCKTEHGCKTVDQCRPYADEWLTLRAELSPWTAHMERSALAKLYQCPSTEFMKLPPRTRDQIRRSRGPAQRDAHFSEKKNQDLIDFCRSTGPRRAELAALTGDKLVDKDGNPYVTGDAYILFDKGTKGGKVRIAPVISNSKKVIELMRKAGPGKVFPKIHSCADIHGYRAEYANALYKMHTRPLEICEREPFYNKEHFNGKDRPKGGLDKDSVYRFRTGEFAGQWLDKRAMLIASRALGHNRISVFASNYWRG